MKKESTIKNIIYAVKTIISTCPSRIFFDAMSELINSGIYLFLDIIFLGYILYLCEQRRDFNEVVFFIGISMTAIFIGKVFSAWYGYRYKDITEQTTKEKLNRKLYEKAADLDIVCYEDSDFFNRYTKVSADFYPVTLGIYNEAKGILISILSNITIIVVIVYIDPLLLIFGIVPFISGKIFGKKLNNLRFNLRQDNIPHEKKAAYSERTVYLRDYAKEMRLSGVFKLMKKNFAQAIHDLSNNIKRYGKKIAIIEFIRNIIIGNAVYFGTIIYLTLRALMTDSIGLSDWLILVNATTIFTGAFQGLSDSIVKINEQSKHISTFNAFFKYEPQISESASGVPIIPGSHLLCFENVTFTYKGQSEPVLKDINLKINPGEKIAIVGHNGAGKSTLVKLILRMYDPDDGNITLDSMNIRDYEVKGYRSIFATVMQDFKLFSFSIAENVLMHEYEQSDEKKVCFSLEQSGFGEKLDSLEDGVHSILTREFDENGIVLSGGESQKIAISRVFAQDCDIVILDEPSSALDPIAEHAMFETMMKACENKSMVFISHRLSSATLVDRIYVMENGKIVESGNHSELMTHNGIYADMFNKQAENYKQGRAV